MSVIAWDGITLAADRQGTAGGLKYPCTKIMRIKDKLVGVSGLLAGLHEARAWLEAGAKPEEYPKSTDVDDRLYLLVIHADGRIIRYENSGWPILVESKYMAAGSGRDFAMAMLHIGRTAVEAVKITCELSPDCGLGIDTLVFV